MTAPLCQVGSSTIEIEANVCLCKICFPPPPPVCVSGSADRTGSKIFILFLSRFSLLSNSAHLDTRCSGTAKTANEMCRNI